MIEHADEPVYRCVHSPIVYANECFNCGLPASHCNGGNCCNLCTH